MHKSIKLNKRYSHNNIFIERMRWCKILPNPKKVGWFFCLFSHVQIRPQQTGIWNEIILNFKIQMREKKGKIWDLNPLDI